MGSSWTMTGSPLCAKYLKLQYKKYLHAQLIREVQENSSIWVFPASQSKVSDKLSVILFLIFPPGLLNSKILHQGLLGWTTYLYPVKNKISEI